MSMADGAPLKETEPFGVTYAIEVADEDGRDWTVSDKAFSSETEAKTFCGTDTRYRVKPLLMFESAQAAKKWHLADAKRRVLAKLSPSDRFILGL